MKISKYRSDCKIMLIYRLTLVLVLFSGVILPVWSISFFNRNIKLMLINIALSYLLAILFCCMERGWIRWLVWEKCDFVSYKIFLEKLVAKRRLKNRGNLQFTLLKTYMILGLREEVINKIQELEKLNTQLSDEQILELQIIHAEYRNSNNNSQLTEETLKEIEEVLEHFAGKRGIGYRALEEKVVLRKKMFQGKWNEAIELLNGVNVSSVYQQVERAYLQGMCYVELEEYQSASAEFHFVIKWGGNTKYVSRANEILKTIPDNCPQKMEISCIKKSFCRLVICMLAAFFVILILGLNNLHNPYSKSVEEAYYAKYHLDKNETIDILYQEEIQEDGMAIIYDNGRISYCWYKKNKGAEKTEFKVYDSYQINIEFLVADDESQDKSLTEEEIEFVRKSRAEMEIWGVIEDFYQKHEIFTLKEFPCVGIYGDTVIETVKVKGKDVNIKQSIKVGDQTVYLWEVKDLDYMEIEFTDIAT